MRQLSPGNENLSIHETEVLFFCFGTRNLNVLDKLELRAETDLAVTPERRL